MKLTMKSLFLTLAATAAVSAFANQRPTTWIDPMRIPGESDSQLGLLIRTDVANEIGLSRDQQDRIIYAIDREMGPRVVETDRTPVRRGRRNNNRRPVVAVNISALRSQLDRAQRSAV
ncbi:MAG: hypothetical protein ABUL72_06265, partial [Armatimonadota bacterium]